MALTATQPTFTRTILQKSDVPGTNHEAVMGISELPPNARIARESHPGPEAGYVLQGNATLIVDGQSPLTLEAGGSWKLPPRTVHEFRAGPQGAKALATWVVEKGELFARPAG